MDARITKPRLSNFLSYDWLKILLTVALSVGLLCVLFTTLATRPRDSQRFEIYGYNGIYMGSDGQKFSSEWKKSGAFSYDILECTVETFDTFESYGGAVYSARRAAGEGNVMFVTSNLADSGQKDENGNAVMVSVLDSFIASNFSGEGENEKLAGLWETDRFLADCAAYLGGAFGENWREAAAPDGEAVKEIFLARNKNDKRYKTASARAKGIESETERLIKLRDDYLFVESLFEEGTYSHYTYTSGAGKEYTAAISLGKLAGLSGFVYYVDTDEDGSSVVRAENIYLTVFNSSYKSDDLRFEAVSFLSYLGKKYGA